MKPNEPNYRAQKLARTGLIIVAVIIISLALYTAYLDHKAHDIFDPVQNESTSEIK